MCGTLLAIYYVILDSGRVCLYSALILKSIILYHNAQGVATKNFHFPFVLFYDEMGLLTFSSYSFYLPLHHESSVLCSRMKANVQAIAIFFPFPYNSQRYTVISNHQ